MFFVIYNHAKKASSSSINPPLLFTVTFPEHSSAVRDGRLVWTRHVLYSYAGVPLTTDRLVRQGFQLTAGTRYAMPRWRLLTADQSRSADS